jgi:hypothetical protein
LGKEPNATKWGLYNTAASLWVELLALDGDRVVEATCVRPGTAAAREP